LLERAIQHRESGVTLTASSKFRSLMPRDGHVDFSALAYQDLGSILAPVAQKLAGPDGTLSPDQQRSIEALAAHSSSSLAYAYAGENRILFASRDDSPFGSDIGTLFGFTSAMELRNLIEEATRGHESGH
jgi:hypothetical protein